MMTDADYPDTPLGNLQLCATSHEWSCSDEEFARWLQKVKAEAWDEGASSGYDMGRGLGDDSNPYRD